MSSSVGSELLWQKTLVALRRRTRLIVGVREQTCVITVPVTINIMEAGMNDQGTVWVGCDLGGWQTGTKDAVVVIHNSNNELSVDAVTAGPKPRLRKVHPSSATELLRIMDEYATRQVVAIDAPLGWPSEFRRLINGEAIDPSLDALQHGRFAESHLFYRRTEMLIYQRTNRSVVPLTAPGSLIGNIAIKAQRLVSRIAEERQVYRPPFDPWSVSEYANAPLSIVEVYPRVSRMNRAVSALEKNLVEQLKHRLNREPACDERDALVAAITAMLLDFWATDMMLREMGRRKEQAIIEQIVFEPLIEYRDIRMENPQDVIDLIAFEGSIFYPQIDTINPVMSCLTRSREKRPVS